MRVADVRELDDGGGAGHGHLLAAGGDCLRVITTNPGKWDLPVPDSMRKPLFAKTAAHFEKSATHSAGPVTQSALHYELVRSQFDSFREFFLQNFFF